MRRKTIIVRESQVKEIAFTAHEFNRIMKNTGANNKTANDIKAMLAADPALVKALFAKKDAIPVEKRVERVVGFEGTTQFDAI